jgi:hypothetical protein
MSKITEIIGSIASSDGLHITAEQYVTATNLQHGSATLVKVAGDVLEDMAPTDDTPLTLTWAEGFARFSERLGAHLAGK